MSTTGLDVFDRAVQTVNPWLEELGEELYLDPAFHGAAVTSSRWILRPS